MTYLGRLPKVVLLGIVSLAITAIAGSLFLILNSIPIGNIRPTHLLDLLEASFFIFAVGIFPVLVYAVPIFTAYFSASSFELWHVIGLAVIPGIGLLIFGNLMWLHFLLFGFSTAITMEVVSRLRPKRFGRDAA